MDGTRRKYLIGGTVTVHLAVTSGIPLPVCGETLQGSFTFSHRFSKMAHLTSSVFRATFVVPRRSQPPPTLRGCPHTVRTNAGHSRSRLKLVNAGSRSRDDRHHDEFCPSALRFDDPPHAAFASHSVGTRHDFKNFIAGSIDRSGYISGPLRLSDTESVTGRQ